MNDIYQIVSKVDDRFNCRQIYYKKLHKKRAVTAVNSLLITLAITIVAWIISILIFGSKAFLGGGVLIAITSIMIIAITTIYE